MVCEYKMQPKTNIAQGLVTTNGSWSTGAGQHKGPPLLLKTPLNVNNMVVVVVVVVGACVVVVLVVVLVLVLVVVVVVLLLLQSIQFSY